MADTDTYVLLDARGMALHSFHSGKDPEGALLDGGKVVNGPAWAIENLLSRYPIFNDVPPRRIIAVWDAGNEYRKALFSPYKAKRAAARKGTDPNELEAQKAAEDAVKALFEGLGITQVSVGGVEADDVIAFLCSKLPQTVVYTRDMDLLQIQGDRPDTVRIVLANELVDGSHEGVPLGLIRLYKSIVGDSTDEYPGIPKMGDAKFKDLLGFFGEDGMLELDAIVSQADWGSLREVVEASQGEPWQGLVDKLWEQREHWYLMYQLASLRPQLCEGVRDRKLVKISWHKRVPSHQTLLELGRRIGLPDLRNRFLHWLPDAALVENDAQGAELLKHLLEHLKDGPVAGFDYETYDTLKHPAFQAAKKSGEYVDTLSQEPTGASFCYGDNLQYAVYIPCNHAHTANFSLGNLSWVVSQAARLVPLVAHNAPYEHIVTELNFGSPPPTFYDTRLMGSHVDENDSLHLKDLSRRFLGYHQQSYKDTLEKAGAADMREVSGEQVLSYGCDDAVAAAHLFDLFYLILRCEGTWDFVREREFEFVHEQGRGFIAGVRGDMEVISSLKEKAETSLRESTDRVRAALTKHCSDYNQQGAERLYAELAKFETAKLKADGKSEEEIEAALDRLWEGVAEGSRYIPYQEIKEDPPEFKPTPKKLSEVAVKLALPPIEKDTRKYLTSWAAEANDLFASTEWQDNAATDVRLAGFFIDTLAGAAHLLKKREGVEYASLVNVCRVVLGEPACKVTTVGDELNFGSPKQMQNLLYGKLGLPIRLYSKVTKGSTRDKLGLEGSPSTEDLAISAALAEDVEPGDWRYPVLMDMRAIRSANTSLGLFLNPMPLWVHPADGMIHPQITNCGTVTRRPSGSAPNFLQLTKKDEGELRHFVRPPDDDYVIISADFNGQELRLTASESMDPALLDAYLGVQKKDVHSVTGAGIAPIFFRVRPFREQWALPDEYAEIGTVSYDDFYESLHDPDLGKMIGAIRKPAKAVNFLLTYLGGYTTLARRLLIKEDLAKSLMDQAFGLYRRLKPWQSEVIEFARTHGYTQTAYGTRRHLSNVLFSSDDGARTRLERQAVNFTIQGCAADILKTVMSEAYRTRLFVDTGSTLIAPVYDEIAAIVRREAAWEYCSRLKEIMELTPPGHEVPMVAEFSVSAVSWGKTMVEVGADITEEKILTALEESKHV